MGNCNSCNCDNSDPSKPNEFNMEVPLGFSLAQEQTAVSKQGRGLHATTNLTGETQVTHYGERQTNASNKFVSVRL